MNFGLTTSLDDLDTKIDAAAREIERARDAPRNAEEAATHVAGDDDAHAEAAAVVDASRHDLQRRSEHHERLMRRYLASAGDDRKADAARLQAATDEASATLRRGNAARGLRQLHMEFDYTLGLEQLEAEQSSEQWVRRDYQAALDIVRDAESLFDNVGDQPAANDMAALVAIERTLRQVVAAKEEYVRCIAAAHPAKRAMEAAEKLHTFLSKRVPEGERDAAAIARAEREAEAARQAFEPLEQARKEAARACDQALGRWKRMAMEWRSNRRIESHLVSHS